MHLDALNRADADDAARALLRCCGSTRWARDMTARRPFTSIDAIVSAGDTVWSALDPADWREAFAGHPRIGAGKAGGVGRAGGAGGAGRAGGAGGDWSAQEQASALTAADEVRARLVEANEAYERRFGYIFIVCATGKSALEMLTLLETRLQNDPETELRGAAEEQRKIMRLRVAKLLEESEPAP